MIRVQPKEGEPLEKTLRRLRKICNNEGVTKAVKRHSYYEKPSVRERPPRARAAEDDPARVEAPERSGRELSQTKRATRRSRARSIVCMTRR
jgi:small subunit ribosomal protein S21